MKNQRQTQNNQQQYYQNIKSEHTASSPITNFGMNNGELLQNSYPITSVGPSVQPPYDASSYSCMLNSAFSSYSCAQNQGTADFLSNLMTPSLTMPVGTNPHSDLYWTYR